MTKYIFFILLLKRGTVFFERHTPKGAPGEYQKTLVPRLKLVDI